MYAVLSVGAIVPKFEQDGFPGCRQEDGKKDEKPNAQQKRSNKISIISYLLFGMQKKYQRKVKSSKNAQSRFALQWLALATYADDSLSYLFCHSLAKPVLRFRSVFVHKEYILF